MKQPIIIIASLIISAYVEPKYKNLDELCADYENELITYYKAQKILNRDYQSDGAYEIQVDELCSQ